MVSHVNEGTKYNMADPYYVCQDEVSLGMTGIWFLSGVYKMKKQ